MQHAIDLAKKGRGYVHPNPLVGCVIVKDNQIISEGYHAYFGGNHAEKNAIENLEKKWFQEWDKVYLYVTLEPCSHYGKTPPCADLIVNKGINKVIVASIDPNPIVAGKGIKKLKESGIEVTIGILEKEASNLNKRFFTYHIKKRPYIVLKWAETKDGFISRLNFKNREDNIISSGEALRIVHFWRNEEHSIMVGYNTIIKDNPQLNVRYIEGRNPMKIILDRFMSLDANKYSVFQGKEQVIVLNAIEDKEDRNIIYKKINWSNFTSEIIETLYSLNIVSVLIEGGEKTLQKFIDDKLFDEIRVIKSKCISFGDGIKAPRLPKNLSAYKIEELEKDVITYYGV